MRSPSVLVALVAGAGVVLVWSAVHGAHIGATVRDLLAGRAPAADPPGAPAPDDPLTARARAQGWRP